MHVADGHLKFYAGASERKQYYKLMWNHFGKKGPSAYIIHSTRNRNVTLVLKCMANIKFRALQLHHRYSDSQCVREDISDF